MGWTAAAVRPTIGSMRSLVLALFLVFSAPVLAQQTPVDLELVLAVDGSASVDSDEFELQLTGIARAFRDPEIMASIFDGPRGRIAVTLMIWSGLDANVRDIGWHLVDGPDTALAFADTLQRTPRLVRPGATALNQALHRARELIMTNAYRGDRKIIDLSGDGKENNLVSALDPIDVGRRDANAAGITVNGLPIMTDDPRLDRYFLENVVGGQNAFMIRAQDYDDFGRAIREKLLREIRGDILVGGDEPAPHG